MNLEALQTIREIKKLQADGVLSKTEASAYIEAVLAPKSNRFERFAEVANKLHKLVWPALALLIFFGFHGPIKQKLLQSQELSFGSFTLKIQEQAKLEGNAELAETLRGLSKRAIEMLMDMGGEEHDSGHMLPRRMPNSESTRRSLS